MRLQIGLTIEPSYNVGSNRSPAEKHEVVRVHASSYQPYEISGSGSADDRERNGARIELPTIQVDSPYKQRESITMAYVKHGTYQVIDTPLFQDRMMWKPDQRAPYSGIYKCTNCGFEIATAVDAALPNVADDFRHQKWNCSGMGLNQWQLVALPIQKRAEESQPT